MFPSAFHDRCKLDELRSEILEKLIERFRFIDIVLMDGSHHVPVYLMFLQPFHSFHHPFPRRTAALAVTVAIVHLLRAVYADAHQPVVVMQKLAPLVGEQGAIGLYHIVDMPSTSIALLQLQGPPVE